MNQEPADLAIIVDFAIGFSSATSPRRTMSANTSAVNTFVIEPISKAVSPWILEVI